MSAMGANWPISVHTDSGLTHLPREGQNFLLFRLALYLLQSRVSAQCSP